MGNLWEKLEVRIEKIGDSVSCVVCRYLGNREAVFLVLSWGPSSSLKDFAEVFATLRKKRLLSPLFHYSVYIAGLHIQKAAKKPG
jgi:hypothetical protein